jgi:AcrR family transcriptional regulator
MPKPLSQAERAHIKKRLIEEAEDCLAQYGLKKATVDEIVRRVKIPKGTFYLFYKSKELLFFDVFLSFHDRTHAELLCQIESMDDKPTPESITAIIFNLYKSIEQSFLYRFLMDGDLELLFRKLPQNALDAHHTRDNLSVQRLVSLVPGIQGEKAGLFSAALRALFSTMMFRREVGEDIFDDALRLLIHGVVIQMFEGAKP